MGHARRARSSASRWRTRRCSLLCRFRPPRSDPCVERTGPRGRRQRAGTERNPPRRCHQRDADADRQPRRSRGPVRQGRAPREVGEGQVRPLPRRPARRYRKVTESLHAPVLPQRDGRGAAGHVRRTDGRHPGRHRAAVGLAASGARGCLVPPGRTIGRTIRRGQRTPSGIGRERRGRGKDRRGNHAGGDRRSKRSLHRRDSVDHGGGGPRLGPS